MWWLDNFRLIRTLHSLPRILLLSRFLPDDSLVASSIANVDSNVSFNINNYKSLSVTIGIPQGSIRDLCTPGTPGTPGIYPSVTIGVPQGSVTIGVPQGSILDPLLFALYINDLPSVVSHSILDSYVDDSELLFSHSDLSVVQTQLQLDLDAVAQWISSSRLCLNIVKSNALLIGSQQRLSGKTLTVSTGGTVLNQVKSVRYLGVFIDSMVTSYY